MEGPGGVATSGCRLQRPERLRATQVDDGGGRREPPGDPAGDGGQLGVGDGEERHLGRLQAVGKVSRGHQHAVETGGREGPGQ